MLSCLPQVFLQETGPYPASSCQDEASASRATPRMTTMAAAAVARAPWQEARAACLKTVLSGRDGAGDSSLAAVVDGEEMPAFGAFLHTYKYGRTQDILPSPPSVSRGHPASGLVNRKWGEAASYKSQAGNTKAGLNRSKSAVDGCGSSATFPRPTPHVSPPAGSQELALDSGLQRLVLPPCNHEAPEALVKSGSPGQVCPDFQ